MQFSAKVSDFSTVEESGKTVTKVKCVCEQHKHVLTFPGTISENIQNRTFVEVDLSGGQFDIPINIAEKTFQKTLEQMVVQNTTGS
jgi:hypothetical protein